MSQVAQVAAIWIAAVSELRTLWLCRRAGARLLVERLVSTRCVVMSAPKNVLTLCRCTQRSPKMAVKVHARCPHHVHGPECAGRARRHGASTSATSQDHDHASTSRGDSAPLSARARSARTPARRRRRMATRTVASAAMVGNQPIDASRRIRWVASTGGPRPPSRETCALPDARSPRRRAPRTALTGSATSTRSRTARSYE